MDREGKSTARLLGGVCLLALGLVVLPGDVARADWIPSALDDRCSPEDVNAISGNIRDAIEASVRRAEATIEAPHGVGDLSCLNDLMNAPIDIFSNLGGILGSLQGGLMDFSSLGFSIDMDVAGMVCGFAAERWAELTGGLGGFDLGLPDFSATAAKPLDRLANGGGWGGDTGSTGSLGNFSGSVNMGFTNQGTGTSFIDITVPDGFDADIFPDDAPPMTPDPVIDEEAFNRALNDYEDMMETASVNYLACVTGRQLAALAPHVFVQYQGDDVIPIQLNCVDPGDIPPPNPDDFIIAMSEPTSDAPAAAGVRSGDVSPISPSQLFPQPGPAPSPQQGDDATQIWDRM